MARLELSRTGKNMKIKKIKARIGKMVRQVKEFNTKLDDTRTNLMEGEESCKLSSNPHQAFTRYKNKYVHAKGGGGREEKLRNFKYKQRR